MPTPTHPPLPARSSSNQTKSATEAPAAFQEGVAEEIIPIVEEEVQVGTKEVTTGRVRVRTLVDVVQEPVRTTLTEETVEVTRVPVGREITQAPEVRTEGGVTIVPVVEEVLVVEKRLVLREELHIRRTTLSEEVEVPVELRRQRAVVERLPAGTNTSAARREEK